MEERRIDIGYVQSNTGQIEGLPANPRTWTSEDLERLKASISETPSLLEARGILVVRVKDKYVALGGNMRLEACRQLGYKEVPCTIMPEVMPVEKLQEIVLKDNGSFGSWDWDELANCWDDMDLVGSGVIKSWVGSADEEIDDAPEKEKADSESSSKCVERERIIISYPDDMRGILEEILGMELNPDKIIIKAEEICVNTES